MFFDYLFGRLTAYVENDNILTEDELAKFYPCQGDDFDIIVYRKDDKLKVRSIVHEEIHSLLDRIGIGQTLSKDSEEAIAESLSIYIDETYQLKRRRKL